MSVSRRRFMQVLGCGAATVAAGAASGSEGSQEVSPDSMGMLVDTTECIGCRKCEWACNEQNKLTDKPLASYEDKSVFTERRWMQADAYTVVNQYANPENIERPIYVKSQCMHCLHPSCVSACLVGALQKAPNGAVVYDAWKCMGCRYCMVACPFQVPAYEYDNTLAPKVQKCNLCMERTAEGKIPACAEMCPPMCLTYGKRSELLALAREKIASDPERYEDHVYGEHEAGGTSWLYLASRPFKELDFLPLDETAYPDITESLQHGIFKYGALPVMFFGLLGLVNTMFNGRNAPKDPVNEESDHE